MTRRHQVAAGVHVDDAPTIPTPVASSGQPHSAPRRGLVVTLVVVAAVVLIGGIGAAAIGRAVTGPACPTSASTVSRAFGTATEEMPVDEFVRNVDGKQEAPLADAVGALTDSACAYLPTPRPSRYSYEEGLVVVSTNEAIPQRMEGLRLFRQIAADAPSPVSGIAIEAGDGVATGKCLAGGSIVTIYATTAAEGPDDWSRAGVDKLAAALRCSPS